VTLSTFIPGQPVPCARPRVVNGRAYTPGDYARWKQGAALLLRAQRVILTGPDSGPLERHTVRSSTNSTKAHGTGTCDGLYEEEKQLRGELIRILGEKAARKAGA
jgi:hypothetical protein